MNIRQLGLIALLGGALMAMGCGNDDNGTGGTGGTGGTAGMGGEGGEGGMGGEGGTVTLCPALDDQQEAIYTVTCNFEDLGQMVEFTARVFGTNGGVDLVAGMAGDVTTCAELELPQELFDLASAAGATLEQAEATLDVSNGEPATIAHEVPDLPITLQLITAFDEVTTSVTAEAVGEVVVTPSTGTFVVDVPSIPLTLPVEVGVEPCSDYILDPGSTPLTFPVIIGPQ